jgi:hypothetical protein
MYTVRGEEMNKRYMVDGVEYQEAPGIFHYFGGHEWGPWYKRYDGTGGGTVLGRTCKICGTHDNDKVVRRIAL